MPLSAPVLPALAGAALSAAALCGAALADPLPMPSVDFALTADLKRGGTLSLAHSQSRMRVEMTNPNVPTPILGLIDLNARKMVLPNVPNMAMEIDIPKEYSMGALSGNGTKVGESAVAGEACDVWKVESQANLASAATFACITSDGIALRTDDPTQLRQLATAFGATYDTRHDHTGTTTDVGHTDQTYLVDHNGNVIITWTADMTTDDLEHDLRIARL